MKELIEKLEQAKKSAVKINNYLAITLHPMVLDEAIQALSQSEGEKELLKRFFEWHKEQGFVSIYDTDIDDFIEYNKQPPQTK